MRVRHRLGSLIPGEIRRALGDRDARFVEAARAAYREEAAARNAGLDEPVPGAPVGRGTPMSDAELREAFRLASMTVTPAPLGRPAHRSTTNAPADGPDTSGLDGAVAAPGPEADVGLGVEAAGAVPPASDAPRPMVDARQPVTLPATTAPAGPPASPPRSAWATAAASRPITDALRTPGIAPAPDATHPAEPLPDPTPADEVQLPGNLGFSVDDFFGGLVRRIERRP